MTRLKTALKPLSVGRRVEQSENAPWATSVPGSVTSSETSGSSGRRGVDWTPSSALKYVPLAVVTPPAGVNVGDTSNDAAWRLVAGSVWSGGGGGGTVGMPGADAQHR